MSSHHDVGYKYLFAHPELVRELLADFTEFAWPGAPAPSAFERVNPGYVSDRFSERQPYALIDQKRLDPDALAAKRGVLAMLFQLELSEAPDVLMTILPMLGAWLREDAQAPLQGSVAAWVEQILVRQFNDEAVASALEAQGDEQMV